MSSTKPILRCQHIKVDGVQCGSPALRGERRCHFHERWNRVDTGKDPHRALGSGVLPALEDANSIQLALAEVMRLAIMGSIEYRVFALLLRALRIAASNVKHLSLTPKPTHMVIDPDSVEDRPLGATAWSETEGKDYDMIDTTEIPQKPAHAPKPEKAPPKMSAEDEDEACVNRYHRLVAGVARHPDFLDKPCEDEVNSAPNKIVMIPWNQVTDDAIMAQEAASTLTP
jgi:hypothetical protein